MEAEMMGKGWGPEMTLKWYTEAKFKLGSETEIG